MFVRTEQVTGGECMHLALGEVDVFFGCMCFFVCVSRVYCDFLYISCMPNCLGKHCSTSISKAM